MSRLADALVLTMTRGVGLGDWHRLGLIEREWALYERLGELYPRILIVSFGASEDEALARAHCPRGEIICNTQGLALEQFEGMVPGLVNERLGDVLAVVVKTNQMEGGSLACAIAERLREDGRTATLIARGGYPYSRFVADREGPASPSALAAACEEARLCAASDTILCTTLEMANDLAWRHAIDAERFRVVPNYVVMDDPPDGGARDPCQILYAGQLIDRKRVELLIEAVALLDSSLGAHLSIIGEGPRLAELEALASERGIRATFEPRVPHRELRERMGGCAIYAQASSLEGHPKAILEAMGAGCAVVACDAPGTREVVHNALTGLLVSGDSGALAMALDLLLRDEPLREKLGRAARDWAHANVALEHVVEVERAAHAHARRRQASQASATPQVCATPKSESPAPAVRFDPALLDAPLETQVSSFANAIGGFWKRLDPRGGARFVMALDDPFYRLQGHAAIVAGDGLHPKHDLTGYHDFFCERIREGERVLDLGSGVGALGVAIARRTGARVTAMDFNPKNIAQAQARAKAGGVDHLVRFHLGDITTELAPVRPDVIVLSNVLEHLKDRPGLLARWRETYACKKFLIRVPMFERDWRVPWKKQLGVEWRLDDTHETEYLEDELRSDLREAGLSPREWITRWGEYWVEAETRS